MGARLFQAAPAALDAAGVADRTARLVFLTMAFHTHDGLDDPIYKRGSDQIGEYLGGTPRGTLKAFSEAVGRLIAAGVVERTVRAAPGRVAHYRLLDGSGDSLGAGGTVHDNVQRTVHDNVQRTVPDNVQRTVHAKVTTVHASVPSGSREREPQENQRKGEGEGSRVPARTPAPAGAPAREARPAPNPDDSTITTSRVAEQLPGATKTSPPVDHLDPAAKMVRELAPAATADAAKLEPPARTCTRHASWDHSEPCAACGRDRQAAERHHRAQAKADAQHRRELERVNSAASRRNCSAVGREHRWFPDGTCMHCETLRDDANAIAA